MSKSQTQQTEKFDIRNHIDEIAEIIVRIHKSGVNGATLSELEAEFKPYFNKFGPMPHKEIWKEIVIAALPKVCVLLQDEPLKAVQYYNNPENSVGNLTYLDFLLQLEFGDKQDIANGFIAQFKKLGLKTTEELKLTTQVSAPKNEKMEVEEKVRQ